MKDCFGKSQVINSGVNEGKGMIKMKERELFSQREREREDENEDFLSYEREEKVDTRRRKRTFSGYT